MSTWPPQPPPQPPWHPEPGRPGRTPWQPEPGRADPSPGSTQRLVLDASPDWLTERMLDQRLVTLTGKFDAATANHVTASLALLDASGDDPVQLRLCGVDADVDNALTVLDSLELMRVPVHASCLGELSGAAVVLPAAAGHRTAAAHATINLREPRTSHSGVASDLGTHVEEHRRKLDQLQQRIATSCGRSAEAVAEDMRTGRILTAEQALGYGLIDHIAEGRST